MKQILSALAIAAALGGILWLALDTGEPPGTSIRGDHISGAEGPDPPSPELEGKGDPRTVRGDEPETEVAPDEAPPPEEIPRRHWRTLQILEGDSDRGVAQAELRWLALEHRLLWFPSPGHLELLEREGQRGRADDEGRLEVGFADENVFVMAEREGLFGCTSFSRRWARSPKVIRVYPARTLTIQVIGADGQPRADVPVAFYSLHNGRPSRQLHARTEGAQGLWSLRRGTAILRGKSDEERFAAGFNFPLTPFPMVPFELDEPPGEPMVLRIPPTAALRVEIMDFLGAPVPDGSQLILKSAKSSTGEALPADTAPPTWLRFTTVDGHVSFPHFATGLLLEVQASTSLAGSKSLEAEILGPTVVGEEAVRVLQLPQPLPVITARLLDPEGQPLVRDTLGSTETGPGMGAKSSVRTDGDGRFAYSLRSPYEEGMQRGLELSTRWHAEQPDMEDLEYAIDLSRPFPPGVTDLGDLRPDIVPILIAGVVCDSKGTPMPDVTVHLQEEHKLFRPDLAWHNRAALRTDESGRFSFRNMPVGTRLRAHATKQGYYCVERKVVEYRDQEVVLVLAPAASLLGRVLLDEEIPRKNVRIHIHGSNGLGFRGELEPGGNFLAWQLPPGKATLEVRASDGAWSRLIETLECTATLGKSSTPDVQVDLRGKLRLLKLRFVDEKDAPLASARIEVRSSVEAGEVGAARRETKADGRIMPCLLARGSHYEVHLPGYRPLRAADVPEEQQLVALRGHPLRLRWTCPDAPAEWGYTLYARLDVEPPNDDRMGASARVELTPGGSILLHAPAPGRYLVRVFAQELKGERWYREIEPARPVEIHGRPGEQEFVLRLSHAELLAAFEKR